VDTARRVRCADSRNDREKNVGRLLERKAPLAREPLAKVLSFEEFHDKIWNSMVSSNIENANDVWMDYSHGGVCFSQNAQYRVVIATDHGS
jgi:hypothetical protein